MPGDEIYRLAQNLGLVLKAQGVRLALAESCTGGWIAKCVTDIAGSSEWFDQGFIVYSNMAKQSQLGVQAATLDTWGAVSLQTAEEMAAGALRHSTAQVAAAVTGIAGPGGGSSDKPVGLVWFAWAMKMPGKEKMLTAYRQWPGDRERVRRQAVMTALQGLLDMLEIKQ